MGKLRDILTDEEAERAGEVFTQYQRFIERVASQHAPGPDHVPDIVQAVGMKVCRGLNGFRSESEIGTWLFRLTVNTARDYYQAERRHSLVVEAVQAQPFEDPGVDPDEQAILGERMEALHEAVDRMRPRDRAIMCDEIGGRAVQHDRRARHRARTRLKRLLSDDPRLGVADAD